MMTGTLSHTRDNDVSGSTDKSTISAKTRKSTLKWCCFDLICSRNVVWNLAWPREAYEAWWRMLRDDGRIVVFDGNHYRHYFDAAYARARQEPLPNDNHIMLGVSPERIDRIARMLPMGQVDRPGWDWSTFIELGAGSVEAVPLTFIKDPETGRKLVFEFVVIAHK